MFVKKLMSSFLLVGCIAASNVALSDEWSFEIEPYAMGSTIDGDSSMGRATDTELEVNFDTILENLDLAGMIHAEAFHESGWGMAIDYGFMELSKDGSGPRGGFADLELRQGVLQLEAIYRNNLGEATLDYLGGVRWWDNDIDLTTDLVNGPGQTTKINEDWFDVFMGARWKAPINEKLKYMIRGDLGGLGLEADFTASLAAGVLYSFNEDWVLDVQYKATMVDYEDGTKGQVGYFAYDTVTHGPILGIIYNFEN